MNIQRVSDVVLVPKWEVELIRNARDRV